MTYCSFQATAPDDRPEPNALLTLDVVVRPEWIDYNGHMTEWQYYQAFADGGENFLRTMGFSEDYRLRGFSFFSVEGHMRNLRECRVGTPLRVFTHMLGHDAVRLYIYQYMLDLSRDIVVATGEHMMVHVDTNKRRAVPVDAYMETCLSETLAASRPQLRPRGMGAVILPPARTEQSA